MTYVMALLPVNVWVPGHSISPVIMIAGKSTIYKEDSSLLVELLAHEAIGGQP